MRGILKKVTVLISYAYARIYLESFARIAENPHVELLLDSGAFTAKNTGQDIRLEDYCDFLRTWKHRICRYISLDVIGDPKQTDFNFREMVRAGFSPVPVHVLGDDKRRMNELFEASDYVALGGLKRPGKGPASKSYVLEKMKWAAGRNVHWLGYTKPAMLTALHPYSCDCSTWNSGIRYGKMAVDGSFFINIKPAAEDLERLLYVFDLVLAMKRDWGWMFAEEFCWERNGIPQRVVRRFKNQFEPIYQFVLGEWKFRPEDVRHHSKRVPQAMGKGAGDTNAAMRQGKQSAVEPNELLEGMAYPGNRISSFSSAGQATGHPASFPVSLPSFFIQAFSDSSDIVYDPFLGSGSTLIAAEQLGRRCYGMEISPAYCDVIVQRWETLTGKKAEKQPQ